MKTKTNRNDTKFNIGYIIISFLLVCLTSFMVLFIIEIQVRDIKLDELKSNEERVVKLENDYLDKELSMIIADLHYLHDAFKIQLEDPSNYFDVATNWVSFSSQRNIFDQIRFINSNGDEKIRINLKENQGYIVPQDDLQNKKDRYYFYEAAELKEGSIHVSPMDLNIEHNEIEIPYKPMIRFSTPLYNENNELLGVIVLNYLADNALKSFKEIALNSEGEIELLNSSGYWLSSVDNSLEWNFMFEESKSNTFNDNYKAEWDSVLKGDNQILTTKGMFTFKSVSLYDKIAQNSSDSNIYITDESWYIVSKVLKNDTNKLLFEDDLFILVFFVFQKNILYFLLVLFISSFVAFLVFLNRKTYSKIKYYSEFDALTKIYNRRAGLEKLNSLFPSDERRKISLSLCFIDVNGLKQVNDILGHKVGDELIISVVNVIVSMLRESDFSVRLGGDEFLIVFNGANSLEAEALWEQIKGAYDKINSIENRPYIISVSHGIVSHDNNQKSQVDELIKTADQKMYEEKRIIKENLSVIR